MPGMYTLVYTHPVHPWVYLSLLLAPALPDTEMPHEPRYRAKTESYRTNS